LQRDRRARPKSREEPEPVLQVSRNLEAIMVERDGHVHICEHCGRRFVTGDARYCSNAHPTSRVPWTEMIMPDADQSRAAIMDTAEAERLTQDIRSQLDSLAETYEAVMPLIREAIDGRAYVALGYPSQTAYVSDRFGGALSRLGVDVRREVVRELTDAGMSTRAIGQVVGVSN
jgi:hypothetical protein